jgi:hypothetical protein
VFVQHKGVNAPQLTGLTRAAGIAKAEMPG